MGLNPWDMAAGSLLVIEAERMVTDIHGDDSYLQTGFIIAATPRSLPHGQVLSPHLKKHQQGFASAA
jgi:myo-inositol-1(or 4)-monophosphatase